jgi:hypothetical protein
MMLRIPALNDPFRRRCWFMTLQYRRSCLSLGFRVCSQVWPWAEEPNHGKLKTGPSEEIGSKKITGYVRKLLIINEH